MSRGIRRKAPVADIDEADLAVKDPLHHAAGIPAVTVALNRGISQAGIIRTTQALTRLNHKGGFDCPGLRLAGTRGSTAPRRVLRERRQSGCRRDHSAHRRAGFLGGSSDLRVVAAQ